MTERKIWKQDWRFYLGVLFGNGLQKAEDYIVGALAGAAAGCILSGIRIWQGTESVWEMLAAILPAVCLESVVILTAGKVGSGDAGMLLVFGLLLGWKACVSILCMGCLLIGVVAGCGMGIGVLHQNSRLPFALFLFVATVITQLLQT